MVMANNHHKDGKVYEVKMARTLGPVSIVFIGIGSLIGGGIFSLLGPAAGLVGPGLFIAMLLGSFVAFLNLQMYVALGTTFPEAGGGYLWVRKGLGNFQGFLAGWLSWFAHAAACGVYALSFGYYAAQVLRLLGIDGFVSFGLSTEKIAALVMIFIFGYVNWRGAKTTGSAGNYVTAGLLVILALYAFFGIKHMMGMPDPLMNFQPFLPNGWMGILAATSFLYIAFEGSEIQVQAGEETKNPAHDIKVGLFTSWAIVSLIYAFISIILIGATPADGGYVWNVLATFKEGAIVESARAFMPFGALLLLVGGLLANLAALNSTIFSSSHVVFALARDKNIWTRFSQIHTKNLTPHLAVIISVMLISLMVIVLPLFDVASAASLLFVLLFLQLNIAGILIHFKYPYTKWNYKVPLFPYIPILATIIYILLAFTMLNVNPVAWVVTIFWTLVGLINYFSYSQNQSREHFEHEIVYEETLRVVPKTGRRILLPISPDTTISELKDLSSIAFSVASQYNAELIAVKVHVVPNALHLLDGASMVHDQHLFEHLRDWMQEYNRKNADEADINLHSISMVARDTVDALLDVVKMEFIDLIIASWDGYTKTNDVVFGGKIDRILRECKTDLIVVKNPRPITSIVLAEEYHASNPYLPLAGEIIRAIKKDFAPKMKLVSVLQTDGTKGVVPTPDRLLASLKIDKNAFGEIKFIRSDSILTAIIKEVKQEDVDLVVINACSPKFLREVTIGKTTEMLAKHLDTSVMIIRGHQRIAEAMFEKILKKIK